MLLQYLNEFYTQGVIFQKIKEQLEKVSSFSPEKIEKFTKFFIKSFLDFLQNNFDENIFKTQSSRFFSEIEIQNLKFENIIEGFNIFVKEFLNFYFEKINKLELLQFLDGIGKFVVNLNKIYNTKIINFYEKILNSISTGIIVLDNYLKILKANEKFFDIINEKPNDLFNLNLKELLRDREGIDIEKLKSICLKNGKLEETELFVKRKNGKKLHRTIYADILKGDNDSNEGFIVYIKDTDYLQYIKDNFSKYLSKQIAEKILSREIKLDGERRNVAVMFADIRNFTNFSEKNDPAFVLSTLNSYFDFIIDIVFSYEGTLDKFIGDAVMIIFGAPINYSNSVDRCIECAVEIQNKVKNFQSKSKYPFEIGIGINYGEVIVGNVGSNEKRVEYTAIGDVVNTADRVQKITPGGKIYITQNVYENMNKNKFRAKFINEVKFKGKRKYVKIYEIIH